MCFENVHNKNDITLYEPVTTQLLRWTVTWRGVLLLSAKTWCPCLSFCVHVRRVNDPPVEDYALSECLYVSPTSFHKLTASFFAQVQWPCLSTSTRFRTRGPLWISCIHQQQQQLSLVHRQTDSYATQRALAEIWD